MKDNFKDKLASNLISVIIIFVLLMVFDQSGETQRNTFLVLVTFLVITTYDYLRLRFKKRNKD
ncbi:sec-independent periplasmic protein translocation protein TatC [Streptococcus loxodontisalivarius]|uniref:RsiW-degrading membrane proteinase PrsW (M82 family) n=1 Tax=Streptococcus loxodontisalivarius TaxID=1349415 RepID=A0ABS2PRJ7_9STRE|nr:sec-independent periplasmic protein translocation protein TatC [Streptococcus loxodontisalivarius]MBM7642661.1 RsiW-degrading membrane proteinase PrsW (M82 family) [Streptococcus loxodontisalivarius]